MLKYLHPACCLFYIKKWNITTFVLRLEPRHLPKYQLFQLFWFPSVVCFLGVHANAPSCQGCKKSRHISQVNYVRFMYRHGVAGRFECLRIQFGTARADQNCKQMCLRASLCFPRASDSVPQVTLHIRIGVVSIAARV